MSSAIATKVARSTREVEEVRSIWSRFPNDVVNTDIDYHLTLVDQDPDVVRPHVVILEEGGEPAALAVGRIEDIRLSARLGYKTLYRPAVRALTISYGGVLGRDDEASASALLSELRSALERGEADLVRLRLVKVGSTLHRVASANGGALARISHSLPSPHWRGRLRGSWDDYLRDRSAKTRANIQRYGRKLEREFPDGIRFDSFRRPADLERLVEDTTAVYARTYQHGLGVGFSDVGAQREIMALALERDWFRGFVLYVQDKPAAFWHGTRYGRTFSTGPTGYDPAYRSHRLGTYVLARLIQELIREGAVDWIDFGFGDAEYKRHFGDECWLEEDVLLFARRVRPLWVNTALAGATLANRSAGRILADRRLADVKRRWRTRLSRG
jgi:Acetyltransferase (GNAT) domain